MVDEKEKVFLQWLTESDIPIGRGACLRKLKLRRAEFDALVAPLLEDGRVIETLPTRHGGAPGYCVPTCTKRPAPLWVFVLYDIAAHGLTYTGLMMRTGKRLNYLYDVIEILTEKGYLSSRDGVYSVTNLGRKAIDGPYDFTVEPEYSLPNEMRSKPKVDVSPEHTAHKLAMDAIHHAIRVTRKENK